MLFDNQYIHTSEQSIVKYKEKKKEKLKKSHDENIELHARNKRRNNRILPCGHLNGVAWTHAFFNLDFTRLWNWAVAQAFDEEAVSFGL